MSGAGELWITSAYHCIRHFWVLLNPRSLERMVEEKLNKALAKPPGGNLAKLSQIQTQSDAEEQSIEPVQTVTPSKPSPTKDIVDWESKTNEELWATKAQGAANEKIRRSFQAICSYNDTLATGDDDRLAVTNLALRELSGVNGLLPLTLGMGYSDS